MEPNLQLRTLRAYGAVLAHSPEWRGRLVITAGEGAASGGVPAAVAIAGGCCLAVDPDTKSARAAMREGGVDFVVNTLDEALRVLKNEVRQKRPLAVALVSDLEPVRIEANERGLLADLALNAPGFAARQAIDWSPAGTPAYSEWLRARGWQEKEAPGSAEEQGERRAWLDGIVRYQRSAVREPRWTWL